jgi:hypothetical protein
MVDQVVQAAKLEPNEDAVMLSGAPVPASDTDVKQGTSATRLIAFAFVSTMLTTRCASDSDRTLADSRPRALVIAEMHELLLVIRHRLQQWFQRTIK